MQQLRVTEARLQALPLSSTRAYTKRRRGAARPANSKAHRLLPCSAAGLTSLRRALELRAACPCRVQCLTGPRDFEFVDARISMFAGGANERDRAEKLQKLYDAPSDRWFLGQHRICLRAAAAIYCVDSSKLAAAKAAVLSPVTVHVSHGNAGQGRERLPTVRLRAWLAVYLELEASPFPRSLQREDLRLLGVGNPEPVRVLIHRPMQVSLASASGSIL